MPITIAKCVRCGAMFDEETLPWDRQSKCPVCGNDEGGQWEDSNYDSGRWYDEIVFVTSQDIKDDIDHADINPCGVP